MNTHQLIKIEDAMAAFCGSAEFIVADGVQHAHRDDPHRLKTIADEFDGRKAQRRLQIDYLAGGQIAISMLFIGTKGGDEKVIQIFQTVVQGPSLDRSETH